MKHRSKKKKGPSLRVRLLVIIMLFGLIPAGLLSTLIVRNAMDKEIELSLQKTREQLLILSKQLTEADYISYSNNASMNLLIRQESDIWDARIQILDGSCRIVMDTYDVDEGSYNISEAVLECLSAKNIITKIDDEQQLAVIAEPMFGAVNDEAVEKAQLQELGGIILVTMDLTQFSKGLSSVVSRGALIILIFAALVTGLAILSVMFLMKPLKNLSRAVDAAADGSLKGNIDVKSYRETAMIGTAVNRTLSRLRMMDESRREFVSDVAHELKTPITSVRVLAESLQSMDEVPTELYKEFMDDITEEIDRESSLIDDLLDISRLDRGTVTMNFARTNINDWLEKSLKRLMPLAKSSDVEILYESFRPVFAEVDEIKLTMTVTNLVENAIKFNRRGGWVRVTLNSDMRYFYIKVSDSGCGIPAEAIDHIFERFYRVDKDRARASGGTGLGLSITKLIVNLHKGAIRVFSEPDEGTTFLMRLPLSQADSEESGEQ